MMHRPQDTKSRYQMLSSVQDIRIFDSSSNTCPHSPIAWHRMSTSFSTSAKITLSGSAVKYGGSSEQRKQTKVSRETQSKMKNRRWHNDIHTMGLHAFYLIWCITNCLFGLSFYLEDFFFGSKRIIKKPTNSRFAEYEFQSIESMLGKI